MTKFEQVGIERQLESDSKKEAIRSFEHSCMVCCYRGIKLDCSKCSIAHVHKQTLASFDDLAMKKGKA